MKVYVRFNNTIDSITISDIERINRDNGLLSLVDVDGEVQALIPINNVLYVRRYPNES